MFPLIKIGPLSIPSRGLILLLGLWLALSLCDHLLKRAKNPAIRAEAIFNLATIALIVGLIGARLAYAARHPGAFIDQPLALILPTRQMLDAEAGFGRDFLGVAVAEFGESAVGILQCFPYAIIVCITLE